MDLTDLQLLAQLIDSMEIATGELEKSYSKKDGERFQESKRTILGFQKEISKQIEQK